MLRHRQDLLFLFTGARGHHSLEGVWEWQGCAALRSSHWIPLPSLGWWDPLPVCSPDRKKPCWLVGVSHATMSWCWFSCEKKRRRFKSVCHCLGDFFFLKTTFVEVNTTGFSLLSFDCSFSSKYMPVRIWVCVYIINVLITYHFGGVFLHPQSEFPFFCLLPLFLALSPFLSCPLPPPPCRWRAAFRHILPLIRPSVTSLCCMSSGSFSTLVLMECPSNRSFGLLFSILRWRWDYSRVI